jgi:3',5'-cyclic AMP phosphodiesterase CpdA
MARLALISDIHGNAVALEAVLRDIETQHVDAVFVLGDLVNRGADPARCLALLRGLPAVSGNGDDYVVQGFEENRQMGPPDSWRSRPLPPWPSEDALRLERRWAAAHLRPEDVASLRDLPTVLHHPLGVDQSLLMCHAAPTDRQAMVLSHSPTDLLHQTFFAPYPGVRL